MAAMNVHTLLRNEVTAFDFKPPDFDLLVSALPESTIVHHDSDESLLQQARNVDVLLTWHFDPKWYDEFPRLRTIFTPAAGDDWVAADPLGRTRVVHGTFHGELLSESLLGAMLFMNQQMIRMTDNFRSRQWNRNLQADNRLLAGQTALIIGYGHIGQRCGDLLKRVGVKVTGVRTSAKGQAIGIDGIFDHLPLADHIVLLLPGTDQTNGFFDLAKLDACRNGAFIYNFGRGNALPCDDLVQHIGRLGGAFLDVVEEEPLPANSPLWSAPNVFITPHSSCVYQEYKPRFLAEVTDRITNTR